MPSFVLRNGNVPPGLAVDAEGRTSVDIAIAEGRIGAIRRPARRTRPSVPGVGMGVGRVDNARYGVRPL